ncbi:MAG TPA: hypothetical protein VK154_00365 [Chitinophagales bacterium]|nr:hypothetical protein [Chitinophagales bacterium]
MKQIEFLFILLLLSACNWRSTNQSVNTDVAINSFDSTNNISTSPQDSIAEYSCPSDTGPESNSVMGKYATDPLIPQAFKDIYANPNELTDSEILLSIPDSLFSRDTLRHRFYFILTDLVMDYSDGAYSEPLYMTVKKYAETYPNEMLYYLNSDYQLSEKSLGKWADGILMEIGIACEGHELACIDKLQTTMRRNCTNCRNNELLQIDRFTDTMRSYYSLWPGKE